MFFMIFPYVNFISIHALVKRATLSVCKFTSTPKDFNPRPRKEGDLLTRSLSFLSIDFNPRPRKEGDTLAKPIGSINHYFNPRPRKEGD